MTNNQRHKEALPEMEWALTACDNKQCPCNGEAVRTFRIYENGIQTGTLCDACAEDIKEAQ